MMMMAKDNISCEMWKIRYVFFVLKAASIYLNSSKPIQCFCFLLLLYLGIQMADPSEDAEREQIEEMEKELT